MLIGLHVKNMALIREEEVSFSEGLNILTGETGAGKSIIIGSLSVALGTGRFGDYVPQGADYALVELIFETKNPAARKKLDQMEIPAPDGQIVISRKYQKGRSVSRVNGETVPISFVRELSAELIDIHGQHQHQSLLYPSFHLELLDRYAAAFLGDLLGRYGACYGEYRQLCQQLDQAVMDEAQQTKALDMARYEINEIEQADLRAGEDEELEQTFSRMEHGQRIMEALSQVRELTGGEGAGDAISRSVRELMAVSAFDPKLADLAGQLVQIEELQSDFSRSLEEVIEDFSYDEQAFYETSRRLDLINHLKAKYGRSLEQIAAYLEKQRERLEQLTHYEAYLSSLRGRQKKLEEELRALSDQIRAVRSQQAARLEEQITRALTDLNFLDVRFRVEVAPLETPGPKGADEVNFLISTNPGLPLRPLQEVASGGELSRVMLAIKSVMADQDEVETLIFDEIDTGISGRTAQKVSEKMAVTAGNHQVICITHLAQIAAMADSHYLIEKALKDGETVTSIRPLTEEESARELARIIGGVSITDSVMDSAREMRRMALEQKKKRV